MIPYEYVDLRGDRLLTDWALQVQQRRSLNLVIARLLITDPEQAVGSVIFKEPGVADIYYAKIRGNVQLRPRCCRGPHRPDEEVTFLARAEEHDDETIPPGVAHTAARRLLEVGDDPEGRRRRYWYV